MPLDREQLIADLTRDEDFVPWIYDDALGRNARLRPGMTLKGNATLCTGWCPDKNPCDPELNNLITGYLVDKSNKALFAALPWLSSMPDGVQSAVANMTYQLGIQGISEFTTFLTLLQNHQFDQAADDLENTLYFKQATERAKRIQALIRGSAMA